MGCTGSERDPYLETVLYLCGVHWEREGPLFRNSVVPLWGALGARERSIFSGYTDKSGYNSFLHKNVVYCFSFCY